MRSATAWAVSWLLCAGCGASGSPVGSAGDAAVPEASADLAAAAPPADGGIADLATPGAPDAPTLMGVHLVAGGKTDELGSIAAGAQLMGEEVRYSITATGMGPGAHILDLNFVIRESLTTATVACGSPGFSLRYQDGAGDLFADPAVAPCHVSLAIIPPQGNGRLAGALEMTVKSTDGARTTRLTGTLDWNVRNQRP